MRESYHLYELPEKVRNELKEQPVCDYGQYRYFRRGDWCDRWVECYLISDCNANDVRLLNAPIYYY